MEGYPQGIDEEKKDEPKRGGSETQQEVPKKRVLFIPKRRRAAMTVGHAGRRTIQGRIMRLCWRTKGSLG